MRGGNGQREDISKILVGLEIYLMIYLIYSVVDSVVAMVKPLQEEEGPLKVRI